MTTFDTALNFVLQYEGGYSNNPKDPGGSTFRGITQNTYNHYRIDSGKTTQDVRKMSDEELRSIYYSYWINSGAKEIEDNRAGLALLLFDMGVNGGNSRARSMYTGKDQSLGDYTNRRIQFYTSLPTWDTFGKGWVRRVAAANLKASELEESTRKRHRIYLNNVDVTGVRTTRFGVVVNDSYPDKTYIRIEPQYIKVFESVSATKTTPQEKKEEVIRESSAELKVIPPTKSLSYNGGMGMLRNIGAIANVVFIIVAMISEIMDNTEVVENTERIRDLIKETITSLLGNYPDFLTDSLLDSLIINVVPFLKNMFRDNNDGEK